MSSIEPDNLPRQSFYFMRHGETQFNRERRFQGHRDIPLNGRGLKQAQSVARILESHDYDRIVCSPASRVRQTVEPLMEVRNTPLHIEKDLMEFFVGSLEGKSVTDSLKANGLGPDDSFMSILPDDAECWEQFVVRVCQAVRGWTDSHAEETLLFVAHGLVFHALSLLLLGQDHFSKNAVPYCFRSGDEGWTLSELR